MKINKICFLLFLMMMMFASCKKTTGWDYESLNGKVRSVTTRIFYTESQGEILIRKNLDFAIKTIFNEKGDLISENRYNTEDSLIYMREFVYENGNLKKVVTVNPRTKEKNDQSSFIDSENGFRIKKMSYLNHGSTVFDWKGKRIICEKYKNDSDEDVGFRTYTYDNSGNLVKAVNIVSDNNSLDMKGIVTYMIEEVDEKKNWIKRIKYYSDSIPPEIEERVIVYF